MNRTEGDHPRATFGLIGAGHIAQTQHLPNLVRCPHVYLKTLCELDEAKLERTSEQYRIPCATADYHEMLSDPDIQAVVIATRENTHAELALAALQADKSVYVEKPLAETDEECAQVAAAQEASGKFLAVGFNRRFAPALLKAKEILDTHGGAWNIHYRVSDEYWQWGKKHPPGVRVIHEICHHFDVIRWLTGSEARSIYCVASRDDDEAIVLQMESGCVATIMNTSYVMKDFPKERLEVMTKKGALTLEDFVELRTYGYEDCEAVYRFAGHTHPDAEFSHKYLFEKIGADALLAFRKIAWEMELRRERGEFDEDSAAAAEVRKFMDEGVADWNYTVDKGWLWAMDHFAECVATNRSPANATARDALQASLLAHAAIKSRNSGKVVKL